MRWDRDRGRAASRCVAEPGSVPRGSHELPGIGTIGGVLDAAEKHV
jgi:hypothetical protein